MLSYSAKLAHALACQFYNFMIILWERDTTLYQRFFTFLAGKQNGKNKR